jgi:muramoyltetrapeptide carboxypeptidase
MSFLISTKPIIMINLPPRLSAPMTFGVFAPSGVVDQERLQRGVACLEGKGHRVIVAPETDSQWRYFAGTDEQRLAAFHRLVADRGVDVMIMARGGYGWSRLLHRIDWNAVAVSGKAFVGFSDFTAFSLGALAKAGLVTFAGPGVAIDFGSDGAETPPNEDHEFMESGFWPVISGAAHSAGPFVSPHAYVPQVIQGPLWGSNLSVLTHLVGTPYFPQVDGGILFLEEIDEQPYAIERMLFQLYHAGILEKQKAILLADFADCVPTSGRYPYSMDEAIETLRTLAPCPVLTGLPFGHVARKLTLPFGATARLEIAPGSFSLEFPAR